MKASWATACAVAIFAGLTAQASAQSNSDRGRIVAETCQSSPSMQERITACTEIVALSALADAHKAQAFSYRALAHQNLNNLPAARADVDQAIRLDPARSFYFTQRGDILRQQNEYAQARIDLDRAIQLEPTSSQAYHTRGLLLAAQGDSAGALTDYDRAVELDPNSTYALQFRGQVHMRNADYPRAIADFDRAIELSGGRAELFHVRGMARRLSESFPGAIADLDRAVTMYNQSRQTLYLADVYLERAQVYFAQRQYGQAIADFDRAAVHAPQVANVHHWVCWARAIAGSELDRARQACDRALALASANERANILGSRGLVALRQQRFQDAFADHDESVRLNPNSSHNLYGRGIARARLGDAAAARTDIDAARAIKADIADVFATYDVRP